MNKHTPFPWTMVVATGSKSGKYIGNYEIAEAIDGEHEGNLALIEAIPSLVDALERIIVEAEHLSKDCPGPPHACSKCEIMFVASEALGIAGLKEPPHEPN